MDWTGPGATAGTYAAAIVGLVVVSTLVPLVLSGPAAADGVAQFSFSPGTAEVSPGETFSLQLHLQSTPQMASGAIEAGVVVAFNRSYVNATGIERGPFMGMQEETTVRTNVSRINNTGGYLVYELVRDPPRGGTHGLARFATITFEVREDAPTGAFDVQVWQSRILLTDGMYQQTFPDTATITVTEGPTDEGAGGAPATTTPGPDRNQTGSGSSTDEQPRRSTTDAAGASERSGAGGAGVGAIGGIVAVAGGAALFGGSLFLMRRYVPASPGASAADGLAVPGVSGACPVCDDAFDDGAAVRDHAWDAHGACHHCGRTFDSRDRLYAHWLEAHEGDLSRLDRRKARDATGPSSGGWERLLPGSAVVPSDVDGRLVAFGVGGIVLTTLVLLVGVPPGGALAGGLTGASDGGVSVGTPAGPPGPEGHDVSRQSETTLGDSGSVHWHATLSVTIAGERIDFTRSSYMLRSEYVHFEGGDGTTVHKHASGVTLTDLFYSIDWFLTDRCLVTPDGSEYCTGESGTLEITVAGERIDAPEEYVIRDGDQIEVRYGRG